MPTLSFRVNRQQFVFFGRNNEEKKNSQSFFFNFEDTVTTVRGDTLASWYFIVTEPEPRLTFPYLEVRHRTLMMKQVKHMTAKERHSKLPTESPGWTERSSIIMDVLLDDRLVKNLRLNGVLPSSLSSETDAIWRINNFAEKMLFPEKDLLFTVLVPLNMT